LPNLFSFISPHQGERGLNHPVHSKGEGCMERSPYERRAGRVPRRGEQGANRARFPRWGNRSVTSNHISLTLLSNFTGLSESNPRSPLILEGVEVDEIGVVDDDRLDRPPRPVALLGMGGDDVNDFLGKSVGEGKGRPGDGMPQQLPSRLLTKFPSSRRYSKSFPTSWRMAPDRR